MNGCGSGGDGMVRREDGGEVLVTERDIMVSMGTVNGLARGWRDDCGEKRLGLIRKAEK